ncbi:ferritin family protein [Thermococcus sp.]|uniref:ferritin family protein n=1 Tax=Thermococcus sp. TaxID=35749 RepID=UPI002601AA5E|nr:ferritin family protein [Thermococcus sp.]
MILNELLEKMIWQENELYNLYKLGETFATYERPEFVDTFQLLAEEELRHRRTLDDMLSNGSLGGTKIIDYLDSLSIESLLTDERITPESLEELIVGAIIREKHSYELYMKLSSILGGSLGQIFRMMAEEELKHAYRLKLVYEGL